MAMSRSKGTEYPGGGHQREADDPSVPQSPVEGDVPQSPTESNVPPSPTIRKLFFEDKTEEEEVAAVQPPVNPDQTKESKESEKRRWNFDFQTETPLPGRYLWVRTDGVSGYFDFKNERGALQRKRQLQSVGARRISKRPRQCRSAESEKNTGGLEQELRKAESGDTCDRMLNEPQDSGNSGIHSETALGRLPQVRKVQTDG